jgi:hypothetical protein
MRILFNYRTKGKFTFAGLITISVLGFIMIFATLTLLVKGFSSEASYSETIEIGGDGKAYALRVSDFIDDERPYDLDWTITEKYQLLADVELNVKPTQKETPYLELTTESQGQNRLDARQRAKNYTYYNEQIDTVINLANYFLVPSSEKYRAQNLNVVLYLPVGYSVYLDESTIDIIYDIENVTDTRDDNMVGHFWVMTQNGLVCMDCNNEKTEWKSDEEWKSYEDEFEDDAKAFENDADKRLDDAERKLKEAQEEIENLKKEQQKK